MEGQTTQINYEVIDHCIMNLNQSIQDTHVQIELRKLQYIFDYSTGSSAEELKAAVRELTGAYQAIMSLTFEAKDMLSAVKRIFQDADASAVNDMGGGRTA